MNTVFLVQVDEDFAIGVGAEDVPSCLQIPSDALKVVELAVHDHTDRFIFVGDGLIPSAQVDDRQSAVAQTDSVVSRYPHALIVGTPMS